MESHAIVEAAQIVGGQSALARKLGITPQAVSKMCATGHVPAERVIPVETATEGRITRHRLRPDIYPEPTPESTTPAAA